jgi:hypothetical protein
MKTRTTIILAVILLLLAGFYYIYDIHIQGKKDKKKSEEDTIFSFEKNDVTSLQIVKGKETLSFEREAGGWKLSKPSAMSASVTAVDAFLGELKGIKKEEVVEEKPADLTPFGLKPPEITVTVFSTSGGKKSESTLLIGSKNPAGSSYYAQLPGKLAVFKIPSSLSYEFEKPVAGWEEKEVLPMEPTRVTRLTVSSGNRSYALENPQSVWTAIRKEPLWTVKMPSEERGDKGKISSYLWDIKNMKVERYLRGDEGKDISIDSQHGAMKISVEQEGRAPETLSVGGQKEGKIIAIREGSGEKMLLKPADVDKLVRNPEDFVDKRIAAFEAKDVAKFEIKAADLDLIAERSKDTWKMKKPSGLKKPPASLDSLLWKFQDARYSKKLADTTMPDFMKNPEATITLWGKGDKKLYTFTLGRDPRVPVAAYVGVSPSDGFYYETGPEPTTLLGSLKDEIKQALTKPSPTPKGSTVPSGVPISTLMPSGAPLNATPAPSGTPLTTPGAQIPAPIQMTQSPGAPVPALSGTPGLPTVKPPGTPK